MIVSVQLSFEKGISQLQVRSFTLCQTEYQNVFIIIIIIIVALCILMYVEFTHQQMHFY